MLRTRPIYPDKIRMSGLPFGLQGWNTELVRTDEESDDCPVYYLSPYLLYWLYPVTGGKMMRIKGRWVFRTDEDLEGKYTMKKNVSFLCDEYKDPYPYGQWSHGGQVEASLGNHFVTTFLKS